MKILYQISKGSRIIFLFEVLCICIVPLYSGLTEKAKFKQPRCEIRRFSQFAEQRITFIMLITNPGQTYWNLEIKPWINCWFLILPSPFLHFALESYVPYFIDRYSDMEAWRDLSGFEDPTWQEEGLSLCSLWVSNFTPPRSVLRSPRVQNFAQEKNRIRKKNILLHKSASVHPFLWKWAMFLRDPSKGNLAIP